jgi:hypothetical protein
VLVANEQNKNIGNTFPVLATLAAGLTLGATIPALQF